MKRYCRTENTEGHKEMLRRGSELANALPQLMTQAAVGRELDITKQAVALIEKRALAKISEAILQAANEMRPK